MTHRGVPHPSSGQQTKKKFCVHTSGFTAGSSQNDVMIKTKRHGKHKLEVRMRAMSPYPAGRVWHTQSHHRNQSRHPQQLVMEAMGCLHVLQNLASTLSVSTFDPGNTAFKTMSGLPILQKHAMLKVPGKEREAAFGGVVGSEKWTPGIKKKNQGGDSESE